MNPYPWLTIGEDGSLGADLQGCTSMEMDRRVIIMQEIEAGRLVVADQDARANAKLAKKAVTLQEENTVTNQRANRWRNRYNALLAEYTASLNEANHLRVALEHIAQSVGAKANGQDARLMAKYAREALIPPAPSRSPRSASPPPR